MTQLDAWDWLRQTRAHPPGAARDGEAADLYRAAIQQAEDLMLAAASTGRAARPLPLFYALSQAGKAIEACHGAAESRSHGLHLAEIGQSILSTRIIPTSGGRFASVSQCVGSPRLVDDVELGALIASLPELSGLLPDEAEWLRPIETRVSDETYWPPTGTHPASITLDPLPQDVQGVREALKPYPQARERFRIGRLIRSEDRIQGVNWVDGHWDLSVNGDDNPSAGIAALHMLLPGCYSGERYWLRPSITSPAFDAPPPDALMTRWLVAYALSMVARYHPREWVLSLDPDASEIAVLLDRCMTDAIERVPALISKAVEGCSAELPQ